MLALEDACFAPRSRTRVLALTESQIAAYRRAWRTPTERIVLLPPAIEAARGAPSSETMERANACAESLDSERASWQCCRSGRGRARKGSTASLRPAPRDPWCNVSRLRRVAGEPGGNRAARPSPPSRCRLVLRHRGFDRLIWVIVGLAGALDQRAFRCCGQRPAVAG